MVSSTAMKGPCKPSRGWSPGTLHVVCPVVLSSFFLPLPVIFLVPTSPLHMSVPPSQLTCSCFPLWCGGGYLHFATEFTLSAWPSFGNCCPWALFEISGEGKTQQQLTSDQFSLPCFPFFLTGVEKAFLLTEITQPPRPALENTTQTHFL